jgi:glutathione reductase (NADPH)
MASVNEVLKGAKNYFYDVPENANFRFDQFKKKRDEVILRLNGAYERNWNREGIELVHGTARFTSEKEIEVDLQDGSGKAAFTAKHILIATGEWLAHVPYHPCPTIFHNIHLSLF